MTKLFLFLILSLTFSANADAAPVVDYPSCMQWFQQFTQLNSNTANYFCTSGNPQSVAACVFEGRNFQISIPQMALLCGGGNRANAQCAIRVGRNGYSIDSTIRLCNPNWQQQQQAWEYYFR